MTKVSNLSAQGISNESTVDLQQALVQHLSGLKEFGITIVPAGKGESFEFAADDSPAASAETSQTPTAGTSSTPAPSPVAPPAAVTQPAAPINPTNPVTPPPAVPTDSATAPATATPSAPTKPEPLVTQDAPYSAATPTAQRPNALTVIQQEVASCIRCPQLSDFRTNTVFGSGDPTSRLVFVGEGPGEDEDGNGLPFQGAPGDLFDKILAACGLKREQVYLLNTIKCRPPKNRNPKAAELDNCWHYGQQQLDIIQPEFICCMGSVAAKTLLNTNLSIGKLRKRFHSYRGSKVLVTYHPTYLLRTSSAKTHAWEDMKMLMNEMGIEIPKR